ncbi:unnamed protein product [Closterium sp. NIES-65]|nr:unnamed protein product [Closterium sp. NIES-65]
MQPNAKWPLGSTDLPFLSNAHRLLPFSPTFAFIKPPLATPCLSLGHPNPSLLPSQQLGPPSLEGSVESESLLPVAPEGLCLGALVLLLQPLHLPAVRHCFLAASL